MQPRFFLGATRGTQCLVLDADGFAIVAFRGTRIESFPDPILNLKLRLINGVDLATDVDFRLDPTAGVHSGFNRALDEVWEELRDHLGTLAGRVEGKTFWFTGHSLGAALATLAAGRAGSGLVSGLYTFGSPRVGDEAFRDQFPVTCFRIVNNNDVVPHLPPGGWPANYAHVGSLKFIDSSGMIVGDPDRFDIIESYVRGHFDAVKAGIEAFNPASLKEAGRAILDAASRLDHSGLSERLESLDLDFIPFAGLVDHMPLLYTVKIWNALVDERPGGG
jgi:pimeloyl-ACP methyl ester carboxylesterase